MPEWVVPTLVALAPVLTALITGVVTWRWGDAERKALQEQVRAKGAQLDLSQEITKAKDVEIETLKLLNYSEAAKHLAAQKELYQSRIGDLESELDRATRGDAKSEEQVVQLERALVEAQNKQRDTAVEQAEQERLQEAQRQHVMSQLWLEVFPARTQTILYQLMLAFYEEQGGFSVRDLINRFPESEIEGDNLGVKVRSVLERMVRRGLLSEQVEGEETYFSPRPRGLGFLQSVTSSQDSSNLAMN